MQTNVVRATAFASIAAQMLIGVVTSVGFFLQVKNPQDREDLNIILGFEVTSQVIEFLWYASILLWSFSITARLRYIDWVFSTPVMLISLALFFRHRDAHTALFSIFESFEIYVCLAVNWVMLAFGFAMESHVVSTSVGLWGGGAALVGSFTALAVLVPRDDLMSVILFWATFGVWGLYGIAAAFDDVWKNVMYNVIDVVSKNGFGLFLFVYALTR